MPDRGLADELWDHLLQAMKNVDVSWDITNSEDGLCSRIQQDLRSRSAACGLAAVEVDRKYQPESAEEHRRYDLRLIYRDGRIVFIEVKGHWPSYWLERKGSLGTYFKHLSLKKRGATDKNKSSALDLIKLVEAPPNETSHVANLLVGSFAIPPHPNAYIKLPSDFDEFARTLRLDLPPLASTRAKELGQPALRRLHEGRSDVQLPVPRDCGLVAECSESVLVDDSRLARLEPRDTRLHRKQIHGSVPVDDVPDVGPGRL